MRYPSRLDHDLFEVTLELATELADTDAWERWCALIERNAKLDQSFPLRFASAPRYGKHTCIELSCLEVMLTCWPWERLSAGLRHLSSGAPLEDVVFSDLSAMALNNESEWGHIGFPRGDDEQTVKHHVLYQLSRWCRAYEQTPNAFAPKLGWWETLAFRGKGDLTSDNVASILEGLVQSLPALDQRGSDEHLLRLQKMIDTGSFTHPGCAFGAILVAMVNKNSDQHFKLRQTFKNYIFSGKSSNDRINREVGDLIHAEELADRGRILQGISENDNVKTAAKRKM